MRRPIRGHYRIDARGRVIRLADVNDPGLTYATPLPKLVFVDRPSLSVKGTTIIEFCVVASITAILIVLVLTVVPRIRKAVVAAQAAAATRVAVVHPPTLTNPPTTSPAAR